MDYPRNTTTDLGDFTNLRELDLKACYIHMEQKFPQGLRVLSLLNTQFYSYTSDTEDDTDPTLPNIGPLPYLETLTIEEPDGEALEILNALTIASRRLKPRAWSTLRHLDVKFRLPTYMCAPITELYKFLKRRGRGLVSLSCDGGADDIEMLGQYCPSLEHVIIEYGCFLEVKDLLNYMEGAAGTLRELKVNPIDLEGWGGMKLSDLQRAADEAGIDFSLFDDQDESAMQDLPI